MMMLLCVVQLFVMIRLCCLLLFIDYIYFFFFKQKTAYEMRISDWSSDVCSSDLDEGLGRDWYRPVEEKDSAVAVDCEPGLDHDRPLVDRQAKDRKSVV